jgi:hypothetical protein
MCQSCANMAVNGEDQLGYTEVVHNQQIEDPDETESKSHSPTPDDGPPDRSTRRDVVLFFVMGLVNNASFVIFVASAKEIAASSVALVYLSASLPSFLIRISAPYWYDKVSYRTRMRAAAVLMVLSFTGSAAAPPILPALCLWLDLISSTAPSVPLILTPPLFVRG